MGADIASEDGDGVAVGPNKVGQSASLPINAPLVGPCEPLTVENVAQTGDGAPETHSLVRLEAFLSTVARLERILDRETAMLKGRQIAAMHDFNHDKSYGLLELSRTMAAMRSQDPSTFEVAARASLTSLRGKLEANLAVLRMHLTAVSEVAAIIMRAIHEHESDGTYTTAVIRKGAAK